MDHGHMHDDDDEIIMIGGRHLVVLSVRRFISALQWISWFFLSATAIVSIFDAVLQGDNPKNWVYDDEDEAAAHGVSNSAGFMPAWAYGILLICSFVAALVAYLWEVVSYGGLDYVGLDLTWDYSNGYLKERAMDTARRSISPCGASYNNYFNFFFAAPFTALASFITFVYIFDYEANRISSVYVFLAANWTVVLASYLYKTYNGYEVRTMRTIRFEDDIDFVHLDRMEEEEREQCTDCELRNVDRIMSRGTRGNSNEGLVIS